jgi:hypothetical protein
MPPPTLDSSATSESVTSGDFIGKTVIVVNSGTSSRDLYSVVFSDLSVRIASASSATHVAIEPLTNRTAFIIRTLTEH